MKYALPVQLKIPIGQNPCVHQSNQNYIIYVEDFIHQHIDFDQWGFCIVQAKRISFLPVLSAVPPFLNLFHLGTAHRLSNCRYLIF